MNYPLTRAIMGFAAQQRLDPDVPLPFEYIGRLRRFDADELWSMVGELQSLNHPDVTAVQLNLLGSHDTPRLRTLCSEDLDSVRLAMLLQMTLPGAPCIYYGDEIGMSGSMDPQCRRAFPTDPAEWDREPSAWLADLAALRHSSRALRDAELELLGSDGALIAYLRRDGNEAFAVVANAGDDAVSWDVPLPLETSAVEIVPLRGSRSGEHAADRANGSLCTHLPGRDGMVVRLVR
jgi:glycosidase